MNNHQSVEHLIDYLHGELSPSDDALVLRHLERCAACKSEYDAQLELSDAFRAYRRSSERELPGDVRARVWQSIEASTRPTPAQRLRAWLQPALGVAAAAAVAVAIAVIAPSLHHGGPAAIDAMYLFDDHATMRGVVPFNESGSSQQWLASNGSNDVAVDALAH